MPNLVVEDPYLLCGAEVWIPILVANDLLRSPSVGTKTRRCACWGSWPGPLNIGGPGMQSQGMGSPLSHHHNNPWSKVPGGAYSAWG